MRSASPAARWISRGSSSRALIQLLTYAALLPQWSSCGVVSDPDALAGHHGGDFRPELFFGVGGAAEAAGLRYLTALWKVSRSIRLFVSGGV